MKYFAHIWILLLLSVCAFAQHEPLYYHPDDAHTDSAQIVLSDDTHDTTAHSHHHLSADSTDDPSSYRYYFALNRRPQAARAVWLGAVIPGMGQIYNQSYWKLPIVYGGLMGCGYAISLNQSRYESYRQAYLDLYNDTQAGCVIDDRSKSYVAVLPDGYSLDRMGSDYLRTLEGWQSTYRRYRDYSIVATILVYALSLVDAYVDASLFDFDISPDLSLQVQPPLYSPFPQEQFTEVHLAIKF